MSRAIRALRLHIGRVLEMSESARDRLDYEQETANRFGDPIGIKPDTAAFLAMTSMNLAGAAGKPGCSFAP